MILAANGSKLAPFKRVSISSSFRSKEKPKSDHVTSLNFGNTIPTRSGRLSTALLCVCICFWGTRIGTLLVQLVIGRSPKVHPKCDLQCLFRLLSFPCYLLACVVLVWCTVQAKVGEGCENARRLGREQGSFARASCNKTAMLRRILDFCFMLNLHERFLQTISFSCIQISSFLESQFNINRHFAISRAGARDSGNNAEIWQFYLTKCVYSKSVF